jgi:hypothetical protein
VVALAYGVVGPSAGLAAALALLLVAADWIDARLETRRLVEVLLTVSIVVPAIVILSTVLPRTANATGELRTPWAAFVGASLMAIAVRRFIARPLGGDRATLGWALVAMAACGGTLTEWFYPAALAGFGITALLARRYGDPGHAPLQAFDRRHLGAVVGMVLVGGTLTLGWAQVLPQVHHWAVRQVMMRGFPVVGFSDRMWLGSLHGMLDSSHTVLRLRGKHVDHLRGIVYTHYRLGRWSRNDGDVPQPIEPPSTAPSGDDVSEVELTNAEPDHYFTPLHAFDVAVSTGVARISRAAVLAPIAADPADRIWFRSGQHRNTMAPPGDVHRDVPPALRPSLERIAREATAGASNGHQQLLALQRHLRRTARYSLQFDRPRHLDPVLHFLTVEKRGHCEYFASSMALLGRAIGIPTRVVGGYRVVEHNELAGHWVVRERHAHAWVEAWTPQHGWRSYDPTPPSGLAAHTAQHTPWLAAMADVASTQWAVFLRWLDARTPAEVASAPLLLMMILLVARWWQRRSRAAALLGDDGAPLVEFDELCEALARRGVVRATSETIEQLAARVPVSELPADIGQAVGATLLRYAALRYGDVGDRTTLQAELVRVRDQLA